MGSTMFKTGATLLVTFLLFTFQGYGSVIKSPSASADDAETLLDDLRVAVFTGFNSTFTAHTILAKQVDAAALDTKSTTLSKMQEKGDYILSEAFANREGISGKCSDVSEKRFNMLFKDVSDALTDCVNERANNSLDFIYSVVAGVANSFLGIIRSQEFQIVLCGKSDENCLDGVIANINDIIDSLPALIDGIISDSNDNVGVFIISIKNCGNQGVSKFDEVSSIILKDIQNCVN